MPLTSIFVCFRYLFNCGMAIRIFREQILSISRVKGIKHTQAPFKTVDTVSEFIF